MAGRQKRVKHEWRKEDCRDADEAMRFAYENMICMAAKGWRFERMSIYPWIDGYWRPWVEYSRLAVVEVCDE